MDEGPRLMPRPFFVFEPEFRDNEIGGGLSPSQFAEKVAISLSRRAGIF
jgi:hypothetical protein